MCSDGGKPFTIDVTPSQALPGRLLRVEGVTANQAEAVRKRWLVASFETHVYRGTYWGIGTEIEGYPVRGSGYGKDVLNGLVLDRLRAVRTDFDTFSEEEQLVLMNHGWSLTDAAVRSYMKEELPKNVPAGTPPSADLLNDPARAARVLENSGKLVPLGR